MPRKPPPPRTYDAAYDTMDNEQLENLKKVKIKKLEELRRDRNYFLLERNQFHEFLTIVNSEVKNTQAHIRNIESQMERMQDTQRSDIKTYLEKVIQLEFEHENNVNQMKSKSVQSREEDNNVHNDRKEELKAQKLALKRQVAQLEEQYEQEIKSLRQRESEGMVIMKHAFEEQFQHMKEEAKNRLKELADDLELRRKMEIHEIEERKNRHIRDLMKNHEKAFALMRDYYNSITKDNLKLIRLLNDEIENLKAKHLKNEEKKAEIAKDNKPLSDQLEKEEQKVDKLKAELKNYHKQKTSLRQARAGLVVMKQAYVDLTVQHAQLQAEYDREEKECKALYDTFEQTVINVRNRSGARNQLLEKILEDYKENFEAKKAQFTTVLRQSNLDVSVIQNVTQKLDDVLSSKNEHIKELKYECVKVTKAHNDLVRVYEDKLRKLGIPADGIEPLLEVDARTAGPATGPAGLIVT